MDVEPPEPEPRSPVSTIAGCALLALVLPLFGLQALGLAGVVLSANGFSRVVPTFWDQDGDGWREVVVGCPDDPCAACDFHDFGPVHLASIRYGGSLCEPY